MPVELQTPDAAVASIRALLIAARPGLTAAGRDMAQAFQQPPSTPGAPVPDRSPVVTRVTQLVTALRAEVEVVAVQGTAATNARTLTARALLETEQALSALARSYAAPDQQASTALLGESVRLLTTARATSGLAGTALGIPWPLQ